MRGEQAQAEIVKNTETVQETNVKNTQTDNKSVEVILATDPARVDFEDMVSRGDEINKTTIQAVKTLVETPVYKGDDHQGFANMQKMRDEQVKAIRQKGTVG
jgi:hypothetical protein